MKEQLAERLLARVMNWQPEDVARERPILQALAAYKYDEYQQFSHGMRFIESLALWLNDLKDPKHKEEAYRFVRERLVFFSAAELQHLVSITYPDFIRPHLLRRVAREQKLNPYHARLILQHEQFKFAQRSCLFLGLSDGARTDVFRRANDPALSHEQVLQNYEIQTDRAEKLIEKLREDLSKTCPSHPGVEDARFRTVVLLDDFSASGTSYLLKTPKGMRGKLSSFTREIFEEKSELANLLETKNLQVLLVLYIATEQAMSHVKAMLAEVWQGRDVRFEIIAVHPLSHDIRVEPGDRLEPLLDAHYDTSMEDEHTAKGGKGIKFGYAGCGLPVVLSHNTPNNSIYPLWKLAPTLRPLFPRVSRHKPA